MRNTKKIISMFVIISIALVIFVSCKGSDKSYKSYVKDDLIIWGEPIYNQAMYEAVKEFNKSYPNVNVRFVKKESANSIKEFGKIKNEKQIPNIICLDDYRLKEFTFKYYRDVLNLNDKFGSYMDKFLKYKRNIVKINNNILAVPYSVKPVALYYKKDIFKEYNIDPLDIKTWDDFLKIGKIILNKSHNKTKMLYVNNNIDMFRILLNQRGSDYFNKEGLLGINDENSKASIGIIRNMYDSNIIYRSNNFYLDKEQKVATVIADVTMAQSIEKNKDGNGKWGVMRLPSFENGGKNSSTLGGTSLLIMNSKENKNDNKLSVKLAQYIALNRKNLNTSFKKHGLFPSYIPAYDCSDFSNSIENLDNLRVWRIFEQISKDIPSINYTENFKQVDKIISTFIDDIIKSSDIDKKLDDVNTMIKNVID